MVKRIRNDEFPANVPINQILVEGQWANTMDEQPQRFLLHDNHDDRERVIIFSSQQCLQTLSTAGTWFVDGNFAIAPPGFCQLYIIRCGLGDSAVTCTYTLLQRKTQASYETMFRQIAAGCVANGNGFPQPTAIHCDFEMAVHQAIRQTLPGVQLRGCFYHLTQVSKHRKLA